MMEAIRELSSHVGRDKKGKDQKLEDLLEIWGAWRAGAIQGLGAGTSLLERAVQQLSGAGWQLTAGGWKPVAKRDQPKQTRIIRPNVPRYFTKPFLSKINKAIAELDEKHRITLIRKYEDGWQTRDFQIQWRWEASTTYTRLGEARRAARNHPAIKQALGRV